MPVASIAELPLRRGSDDDRTEMFRMLNEVHAMRQADEAVKSPKAALPGGSPANGATTNSAMNNVLDAGRLLDRLLSVSRVKGTSSSDASLLPSGRGYPPGTAAARDEVCSPSSAARSESGAHMAQALCLRLLALKFDRVVLFALNIHAMRSAYAPRLPGSFRPAWMHRRSDARSSSSSSDANGDDTGGTGSSLLEPFAIAGARREA